MDILNRTIAPIILSLIMIGSMSCNKLIYDDLTECPQGIYFMFHTQSPCQTAPSYPVEIMQTRVFAFDESGVLVQYYDTKDVRLSEEYRLTTDYVHIGASSFVAWGSEDLSKYDFSHFEVGKTTKREMTVSLHRQADKVTADMPPLYVGEPIDGILTQRDYHNQGTHYNLVNFRMTQLTNTVRLTVRGLNPSHQYSIEISAANSKYDLLGSSIEDERFIYTPTGMEQSEGNLKADFRILKLECKKDIRLIVSDLNLGKEVYSADLVDDLIAYQGKFGHSPINLECEHNYVVVVSVGADVNLDNTFVAVQATINQWNIVFRDVDLTN